MAPRKSPLADGQSPQGDLANASTEETNGPFRSGDPGVQQFQQSQPALRLEGVSHVYGADVAALTDVSLTISNGEFVTLLGPSGSGKTTLLMTIAGFVHPSSGKVFSDAGDITETPPQRRNFGMVFQSYALFPHMTVRGNVSYPLAVRQIRGDERKRLTDEALSLVDLVDLGDRKPSELSGGQQQRVALARALVYQPSLLLLDEPLGALDRALRERMQVELRRLHQKLGVTVVYVTHDQDEALRMSDRIVVLHAGTIEQVGSPTEIYTQPVNEFVANFVGETNMLPVEIVGSGSTPETVMCRLPTSDIVEVSRNRHLKPAATQGLLLARPDMVQIRVTAANSRAVDETADPSDVVLRGTIADISFNGSTWRYDIETPFGDVRSARRKRIEASVGDGVEVRWKGSESWIVVR